MRAYVCWSCCVLGVLLACNLASAVQETPISPSTTPSVANPTPGLGASITATPASGTGSNLSPTATPPDQPFFVTITNPLPGARLPVAGFRVEGLQRGSFENNVILQLRTSADQVLQEIPVTSSGNPGEIGAWQVQLDPDDSLAGQTLKLYAYYTSARDGSEQANYWINITLTAN